MAKIWLVPNADITQRDLPHPSLPFYLVALGLLGSFRPGRETTQVQKNENFLTGKGNPKEKNERKHKPLMYVGYFMYPVKNTPDFKNWDNEQFINPYR